MTLEGHAETVDAEGTSVDDSPVIKALRKQIKDLESQVKSVPTRESIEAEVRESMARDAAISTQLIGLGHPAGMLDAVKGRLGDAEVSRDSVAEALRGIGYQVEDADATAGTTGEAPEAGSALRDVTALSAKVRSAATGETSDPLKDIGATESRAELIALMEQQGLLAQ